MTLASVGLKKTIIATAGICILAFSSIVYGQSCRQPSPQKRSEIISYVMKRYHIVSESQIVLINSEAANASCFWKLHYETESPKRDIVLFLSPDGGYLVPAVYDLGIDPLIEEKARFKDVNSVLLAGRSPSIGPTTAPVDIVEFSDFQCPYCKRLTDVLEKDVIPGAGQNVHVVFKNFPLPMHSWAKPAAQMGECVTLQSPDAFWKFHNFLFENQQTLTPGNLREKVSVFVSTEPTLDKEKFDSCLDQDLAVGPVQQDISLGQRQGVRATPTLFINGIRYEGMKDATQLRAIIAAVQRGEIPESLPVSSNMARPAPNSQCEAPSAAAQIRSAN